MKQYSVFIELLAFLFFSVGLTACDEEELGEEQEPSHEYVDLGLPSGLKWATMNVGAETPEDYGSYFSWGEVTEKEMYVWDNNIYKYDYSDDLLISLEIVDTCGNLTHSYDAASVNWGGDWRIPTEKEFKELIDCCNWEWTSVNGVNGFMISSKAKNNTNSIFLPAGGYNVNQAPSKVDELCSYWCASFSGDDSSFYSISFRGSPDEKKTGKTLMRYSGLSIRPVIK